MNRRSFFAALFAAPAAARLLQCEPAPKPVPVIVLAPYYTPLMIDRDANPGRFLWSGSELSCFIAA